jgi:hypothetical protein
MRTRLRTTICGLLLGTAFQAAPGFAADGQDAALVSIEAPGPGTAATLLSREVMVVRDLERYLLVVTETQDLERMRDLGLTVRVLDEPIGSKTYYTVGLRDPAQLAELQRLARVLRSDAWDAVVEASPAEALEIVGAGFEIAKVFLRPIRPARIDRAAAPRLRAITPDPEVQAIVDAVSSVQVDGYVQRLQDFVTRYAAHDSCQAAAQYIKSKFQAAGIDSVYLQDWHPTYHENVVAVIPGQRSPEKIVVVGAHYDSYTGNQNNAPGADDDASGTACVIECARVLAGHEFAYTIEFVAFCAEEMGLLGSEAFAAAHSAAGDEVVASVCVDMIGYVAGGDVVDLDIIDNASSVWIRDLAMDVRAAYVPELAVVDGEIPGGASSDHASFWAHGYDAILFFEDTDQYSPYIHTTNDVVGISYNHPVLAERSVKLAAGLLATLAKGSPVEMSHTPLTHTEDSVNPYRVSAEIVASGVLESDSLLVRYTTGGPVHDLTMSAAGPPDEYDAYIPAQSGGTFVNYWLVAEDTEGNRVTDPEGAPVETHEFFVGTITTVLLDDFEIDRGFTVGDVGDNASTGIWVRVDPNGTWSGSVPVQPEDDHTGDGTICWVTGNAPPGASQGDNDVDGGKTTLLSPILDVSGYPNAWVRYYRWYTNDTGAAPETDDWVVDVSSNAGAVWNRLETLTSSDRMWRLVEENLEDHVDLTSQLQFRFIARDDSPGSIVEAGVDDFSIAVFQETPTGLSDVAAFTDRLLLAPSVPNPFGRTTSIRFAVPAPGREVKLRVFDVAGRLVATLLDEKLVVGPRSVVWDGRDSGGRQVSSGVYFYRLDAGEERLSRRLVLLR